MNPFELYGPDFLYFYAVLGGTAILALWLLQRGTGGDAPVLGGAEGLAADPYLIAFLRGGEEELVRVTALSLFDRGFLAAPGLAQGASPGPDRLLLASKTAGSELLRRPIEQAVHKAASEAMTSTDLIKSLHDADVFSFYQTKLEHLGLVRTAAELLTQRTYLAAAMVTVLGAGVIKVMIGLSRGRPVIFLFIMIAVFSVLIPRFAGNRITRRGKRALDDLNVLFISLKVRASGLAPGGKTNEVALLAAVFG
ncbi:MAG TPA: TIGR04222 domain-containing membrane protein, partial [Candidatus Solibacter sp.]|nr:TIGR04222 domain-containing membrane protein [Candidatus Solibacter sp.]